MENPSRRLETLRDQKNISRVQLAAALGFPKNSIEKFETGRATPTKEQYEKMARYLGVSAEYLRCESDDPESLSTWLNGSGAVIPNPVPAPAPRQETNKIVAQTANQEKADSAMFNLLLKSDSFRSAVLEVLKSPEGQELIRRAMKR